MNVGKVAVLLLLFSLFIPWTIIHGTNTIAGVTSQFYILEFPFMAYNIMVFGPQGTASWWEAYQSSPKYLGIILIIIGIILTFFGITNRRGILVKLGGISTMVAVIFFAGSGSTSVYIPFELVQNYTTLPIGLFIPAIHWALILHYSKEMGVLANEVIEIYCGHCGKVISPDFSYCPFCGTEILTPKCGMCGKRVFPQHDYCPYCGAINPSIKKDDAIVDLSTTI